MPNIALASQLDKEKLKRDKKECRRIGPVGVGERALYLNSFFMDRIYYIPYGDIRRVYKRVAMSSGGYTGKGIFASIPYLVVEYGISEERQFTFRMEAEVDAVLELLCEEHPELPLLSKAGEQRMKEAAEEEKQRYLTTLSPKAKETEQELENAKIALQKVLPDCNALARAAKQLRMVQSTIPYYRHLAWLLFALSFISFCFFLTMFFQEQGFAIYTVLLGFSILLFLIALRVQPTGVRHKEETENTYRLAVEELSGKLGDAPFPVPARYAHPEVLNRMLRLLWEGKAEKTEETLEALKRDLQAMNPGVQVTEEEYREIVTIKPMFLVAEYV